MRRNRKLARDVDETAPIRHVIWMISDSEAAAKPLSKNEGLKEASDYLRGTILEGLADESTGAISDDDTQLTKFHGIYQQDDRDLRTERRKAKLEKAFIFMIRVRVPGGIATPDQWLQMDRLADQYANGTLKLTTRQAFQLHGIVKKVLKTTIAAINQALLDTIAACGDVNRNVMCNVNPAQSEVHAQVHQLAKEISDHLTPKTRAYHEIWLDEEKVAGGEEEVEPIYGKTYLPRKFKTVIAVPPSNDVDIFAHDLGFIAIREGNELVGYNVTVGGGLGMSHNKPETFPRLADVLGFVTPEQALMTAEAVVKVQRDHGDRTERKHARMKYTVEDHGVDWFRERVEEYTGFQIQEARPFQFTEQGDTYGWLTGIDGLEHLTLFIQNGRVRDTEDVKLKTALREIAELQIGDFRLTPNQNLCLGQIPPDRKAEVEAILAKHHVPIGKDGYSGLRLNSMACVALPTCGLALAESERYLPDLVGKIEETVEKAGLHDQDITIRMTGCPNGCARPYLAEIGFVGKAPGKYNLYLGAKPDGTRLNTIYKESVKEEDILAELEPIILRYAREREDGEAFGDFVIRAGYVKPMLHGRDFQIK